MCAVYVVRTDLCAVHVVRADMRVVRADLCVVADLFVVRADLRTLRTDLRAEDVPQLDPTLPRRCHVPRGALGQRRHAPTEDG